ncbi:MAG: hypothetical protein ACRDL3_06690 [Solirubrobacterales bacterium]
MPLPLDVEFLQQRFDVSAVKRVKRAFESLDVLLRHRLLPHPGGFEGLFGIEEAPNPRPPAVPEIDQVTDRRPGLGSACLATLAHPAACYEAISEVPDLKELEVELGESLVRVSEKLAAAFVSPIHGRFAPEHRRKRRTVLDRGGSASSASTSSA